jgi:hypothetical protein
MFKIFSFAILIVCISIQTSESGLVLNNNFNIMNLFGSLFTIIENQIMAQIPSLNTTKFNCTSNVNSVNCVSCMPINAPLIMLKQSGNCILNIIKFYLHLFIYLF